MTAVESLQVDCSNGEGVWKAIAHASHHRWDRRGTPGASYERADGGVTLVVRLQGCFASLCPVLNGGRVFSPPPARGTKVVFIGDFDSNVGMLSTHLRDRTVDWGDLYNDMRSCLPDSDAAPAADPKFQPPGTPPRRYVGMEGLQAFLDDERLLLFAVNQHQAAPPAPHAKLLSLPLGLAEEADAHALWRVYRRFTRAAAAAADAADGDARPPPPPLPPRRALLAINNSGWQHRAAVNARVNATFGGTLINSYGSERPYWEILMESKFVLAPSGMGYDTFRLWEALAHGAVPIIDACPGFSRTYAGLPVLTVADWGDVTPALLQEVWHEFAVERTHEWDYRRLTERYWLELLADAAATGSVDAITAQHPLRTELRGAAAAA
ncbi:hypothetical protein JKP88DRAFT_304179 [Tribonema minus]|uniref:RXYLT1 C-terminal domain-containing protein n=1 Tax=Tribonema minus TaxID=303371 RepID=A0A836CJI6_9STRA|nr:hypothetical protein JKP88DRAFT_304179 [Tribonema minus]